MSIIYCEHCSQAVDTDWFEVEWTKYGALCDECSLHNKDCFEDYAPESKVIDERTES